MSDGSSGSVSITITKIHHALQQLLDDYLSEKAESQADEDTRFIEYWECACRTIYEVATALNIPFDDPWVDPVRRVGAYEIPMTHRRGSEQITSRVRADRKEETPKGQ
jgi:hypothetical protein